MAIFNELFLNNKFKKSNKYKPSNKVKRPADMTQEEKDNIKKELSDIVKRYNRDPEVKKKALKELEEYWDSIGGLEDEGPESYTKEEFVKFHPFICKVFDHGESWIYFSVCDEIQEYRAGISGIINDMIKELRDKIENCFRVEPGDGDEGCIYVDKIEYV